MTSPRIATRCWCCNGPSCTGKSRLARSLFGVENTLVVDVQHAEHPDLRSYHRPVHKAVLMDEVASPKFIVENKKVLQAHVDGAILGQSSTQLFTYDVFVWRTPLMLTTNNYDYSKFSASDINWIETNAVAVCIHEPASLRVSASASCLYRSCWSSCLRLPCNQEAPLKCEQQM